MVDLIVSLLGGYEPLTDTDGNVITGLAGLDWDYLIAGIIFILCLIWVGLMVRTLLIRILE